MTLCLAITSTADERCEDLLAQAKATADRFKQVLTLFARCHKIYNGTTYLSDSDLNDLRR